MQVRKPLETNPYQYASYGLNLIPKKPFHVDSFITFPNGIFDMGLFPMLLNIFYVITSKQ